MDGIRKSISRAEFVRFMKSSYNFSKSLFEQGKTGTLKVSQCKLEGHLRNAYSSHAKDEHLPEMEGLVCLAKPGFPVDTFDLK